MSYDYETKGARLTPLTYEEERHYAREWIHKKCIKSRDKLIANYVLYARKLARRRMPNDPEDDVLIVAHNALMRAVDKYDPDRADTGKKQGRICNILYFYILQEHDKHVAFRDAPLHLPKSQRDPRTILSLDIESPDKNETSASADIVEHQAQDGAHLVSEWMRRAVSGQDQALVDEQYACLHEAIEQLPKKDQRIIRALFFDGKTLKQVGDSCRPKVTREAIRQRKNAILEKLSRIMRRRMIFRGELFES